MCQNRRNLDTIAKFAISLVHLNLLRNVIPLHDIDKYIILVTAPIILILELIIIIAMLKYHMVSRPPEDALFALIITESVACCSLFSHASKPILNQSTTCSIRPITVCHPTSSPFVSLPESSTPSPWSSNKSISSTSFSPSL